VNYYSTGRPLIHGYTYPRLLARRVVDLLGLDGSQTVLDVGTGPGFLALDFHPFADKVIGVGPEPEMLNAARRNATKTRVKIELVVR
jgi:predicted RNA methylase